MTRLVPAFAVVSLSIALGSTVLGSGCATTEKKASAGTSTAANAPAGKPAANPPPLPADTLAAVPDTRPIYFGFDSAELDLTDADRGRLAQIATYLREHPDQHVAIEGHADERGTNEYNLALGDRRARAAVDYLKQLGVVPEQISWVSFGEERPAVQGKDEKSFAGNRRDEIRLGKTGRSAMR